MCKKGTRLKFCTCEEKTKIVHNKNSRKNKNTVSSEPVRFRWTLKRITGPSEFTMDGLLMEPHEALDKDLTTESILEDLNENNCFDFDYAPVESDNLEIRGTNGKFVSFIYTDGGWITGSHNPFTHRIEKFRSGDVQFENP